MVTLTLQPDGTAGKDGDIYSAQPTTNRGTEGFLSTGGVGGSVNVHRFVIQFDLSSIPANATIDSAVLSLYVQGDSSSNARTIRAYRLLKVWDEAVLTWIKATTTDDWGTAGAGNTTSDREATDIGTGTQPASPSVNDEVQITLTASKIQEWIDGTLTNKGLLIKVDTEDTDSIDYNSSDHATAGTRPKLVVNYTIPGSEEVVDGMFLAF